MYWPALTIRDQPIDLCHLEPFVLDCAIPDGLLLRINTRFSNHCFTEDFDDRRHDLALLVLDHRRRRAFNRERYDLSHRLPEMVRSLPTSRVHQTHEGRNYLYFAAIAEVPGAEYRMFFRLSRAQARPHDLELFVESAYPVVPTPRDKPRRPNAIRFHILAQKVHRGQPVRFSAR